MQNPGFHCRHLGTNIAFRTFHFRFPKDEIGSNVTAGNVLNTSPYQKWYKGLWTNSVHRCTVAEEFVTFPHKVEASKLKSDELI